MINIKTEEEKKRFVVDDDDKACWALKKIKECKEKIEQKEKLAESQIYQVEKWLEDETKTLEKSINYFENILHDYAETLKREDPKLKTHSLPFGKLQYRRQRPKWEYEDDKLLKSVKNSMPDIIQIKERVDKNELKKKVEIVNGQAVNPETGEIIEGVAVVERGEKFQVKVD